MTQGSDNNPLKTGGALGVFAGLGADARDPVLGRTLGDYEILELIAAGGMGRVYRARRADGSFEREVAIKVSAASGISAELHSRFAQEQSVLAGLNHPNVCQLYDAHLTDEGWPYIVMELVDGQTIVDYCEQNGLSARQRLHLLIDVVDAVAYAHSRLIVHRDIKPANVLINADGQVKLLDFGIAKLLESEQALTRSAPMTPRYASPEQLLGQPITVASDIYQLGLLLFEVVTGGPLSCESSLTESIQRAAAGHTVALPASARSSLDRELVLIIEQCLRFDPEERYRSASRLLDDLTALRGGYPVAAAGQGSLYRLRKFLGRNVAAATIAVIATVAVVGGTTWYTIQINAAREEAEHQAVVAQREAETAEEVIRFLTDVFETADPEKSRGENVTARQLLDKGAADIDKLFADRPVLQARLQHVIGGVYRELGLLKQALPLAESAYALRSTHLEPTDRRTMIAGNDLAIIYDRLDRYDEAINVYLDVLERQKNSIGIDDPETLKTMNNLGAALWSAGRADEAIPYLEETLERRRRVLGPDHPEVGSTITNIGVAYAGSGNLVMARQYFEEALDFSRRVEGDDAPSTIIAIINLGALLKNEGFDEAAMPYSDEAWELALRVLGPGSHLTLTAGLLKLDVLLRPLEKAPPAEDIEQAEELLTQMQTDAEASLGSGHSILAWIAAGRGAMLLHRGEAESALHELNKALDILSMQHEPDHYLMADLWSERAYILFKLGRLDDALADYEAADQVYLDTYGADNPDRVENLQGKAAVLAEMGRPDTARQILRDGLDVMTAALGPDHPRSRRAAEKLAHFQSRY